MAKSRLLSIFLVAVLVASCLCFAQGAITGTILNRTLLQGSPGAGTVVLTTLTPRTVVTVLCRTQSDFVFDDPWWLKVTVPATGMVGWVADYYVDCGGVGNCNIFQC
ncbi:hypothetical protein KC19_3G229100 [Ceratodon purpureus]|uniref:SH3 domain-containing protein n=1 Tax=Ceratodon purpureus TaxID=3225 RepID=A0A8T0INX4_CERPU|nr:hypothetical protein KC19_3G229100 [Ceratodon purpureus]KAG0584705.1 hypothetical protein KC19_3G229100 [Ceratodon purpureus]KAG0584706.1 hypothetical protein KC19_3G229100 [Ceratodon purpureus]